MDWQPIETAPRDGTRILLYRPLADRTNDDKIDIKRGVPRDNSCWEETIPPGMDATNYTDGACKATHWMPLPEPPKVGVGGTATLGHNAIGQGSDACGASPAPTGYAQEKP